MVKRAPGSFLCFLRLLPLTDGLHRRLYLLRAKGSFYPLIVGGDMPQGLVLHLHRL